MAKKNGTYKVESGIPIPDGYDRTHGLAAALRKMQPGESMFLNKPRATVANAAQHALGAGNYTARQEKDGFRVWRTK